MNVLVIVEIDDPETRTVATTNEIEIDDPRPEHGGETCKICSRDEVAIANLPACIQP